MDNQNQNEIEFDLLQMVRYLLRRSWIIVLAAVVFAVGGYMISKRTTVPIYTAHCRLYVYDANRGAEYEDFVIAGQLRNDCETLITGRNVADIVVEELELDISSSQITSSVKVAAESGVRILQLEYTDTDPERAALILNKICEVAEEEMLRVTKIDGLTQIYEAVPPEAPSNTDTSNDTVLAAAMGALLSVAVLVVLFLMDDTVRSEDDVERYLGLSTLASVPMSTELGDGVKTKEKAKGVARFLKK